MTALKDALIQLSETVELQYLNLTVKGDELEGLLPVFSTLGDIKDEGCICDCVTGYNMRPSYHLPALLAPVGVITFGTPTRLSDALSVPFSYSESDADGYYYKLDGGSQFTTVSPVALEDLNHTTTYSIQVAAYNAGGVGTWYALDVDTLGIAPSPASGGAYLTFGTPTIGVTTISQPFTYAGSPASEFIASVDGITIGAVTSPIELDELTEDTAYEIAVFPRNSYGDGYPVDTTVTTLPIESTWVISFDAPTVGLTTISQPFSYNGSDAISFTAELDSVSIGTVTSPIELDGLDEDTLYEIKVTVVKTIGFGDEGIANVSTDVATDVPLGSIMFTASTDITSTSFTVNYTYTLSDASSYTAHVEEIASSGGEPIIPLEYTGNVVFSGTVPYPSFPVTGLTPGSWYATTVTPVNSLGEGIPTTLGI